MRFYIVIDNKGSISGNIYADVFNTRDKLISTSHGGYTSFKYSRDMSYFIPGCINLPCLGVHKDLSSSIWEISINKQDKATIKPLLIISNNTRLKKTLTFYIKLSDESFNSEVDLFVSKTRGIKSKKVSVFNVKLEDSYTSIGEVYNTKNIRGATYKIQLGKKNEVTKIV